MLFLFLCYNENMNNRVYKYLTEKGIENRIIEAVTSTETVEMASDTLDCSIREVAKTLSFYVPDPVLIVTSGDVKIHDDKFRTVFGCKPRMIPKEEIMNVIGHEVGGVCPFNPKENVKVYLDISLLRNTYCYPACGVPGTGIKLTVEELMKYTNFIKWVDVTKNSD